MTTANNPVVTAKMLREALGHVLDVLDGAGGFSDVPAVREAKRTYIMSRAMTQASPPPDEMVELIEQLRAWPGIKDALSSTVVGDLMCRAAVALQSIGPMRGWDNPDTSNRRPSHGR